MIATPLDYHIPHITSADRIEERQQEGAGLLADISLYQAQRRASSFPTERAALTARIAACVDAYATLPTLKEIAQCWTK